MKNIKILDKLKVFSDNIKQKFNDLMAFIGTFTAEILVVIGALFIILATFKINTIAGLYCLGFIVIVLGIFLSITKK